MIKVECESCRASYEVDERRLPARGIKMRCTKCGTSFMVEGPSAAPAPPSARGNDDLLPAPKAAANPAPRAPGRTTAAGASPHVDLPAVKTAAGAPPRAPIAPPLVGPVAVARPAATPGKQPMTAPATPGARPPPAPFKPPAPASLQKPTSPPGVAQPPEPAGVPSDDALDLGLPAPEGDTDLPGLRGSVARPLSPAPDLDLPAPKAAHGAASVSDVDLPAPKTPIGQAAVGPVPDFDLPAPKAPDGARRAEFGRTMLGLGPPGGRPGAASPPAPRAGEPSAPALAGDAVPDRRRTGEVLRWGDDLDLPMPRGEAVAATPTALHGLDLPAPKGTSAAAGDIDLPTPKVGARNPAAALDDLDLPVPKPSSARSPSAGDLDLDLPVPKPSSARSPSAGGDLDLDLPVPKPSSARSPSAGDLDLDLDLPIARAPGGGSMDWPAPAENASLGGFDLPVARSAPLPHGTPTSEPAGIPAAGAGLPAGARPGFGELDLGNPVAPPRGSAAAALFADDSLDLGELPSSSGSAATAPPPGTEAGDDLALDLSNARDSASPSPAARTATTGDGRRGAGGPGFGEIDLGGDSEGTEFGDLPRAPEWTAAPSLPRASDLPHRGAEREQRKGAEAPSPRTRSNAPTRKTNPLAVAVAAVVVIGGAGAALSATPYGLFGIYEIERHLPAAGSPQAVHAVLAEAEPLLAADTYEESRRALRKLGEARRRMGLNRALLARSALHEALYQHRFGADVASANRISAIFARLEERGETGEGVPLARAAVALWHGRVADAKAAAEAARSTAPDDPWAAIAAGEAALAAGDAEGALSAFRAASTKGGGARALWGIARALELGGAPATDVVAAIDATLEASPRHVDARTARARAALEAGDVDAALRWAREAAGLKAPSGTAGSGEAGRGEAAGDTARPWASRRERAEALVVLAAVHERRGHMTEALEAYEAALALAPGQLGALVGAGRVLLAQQRHGEALARFEAALGVDAAAGGEATGRTSPTAAVRRTPVQDARLGAARALLSLDRARDAKVHLDALLAERPDDVDVLLALGETARRMGDDAGAEQHFRDAVRLAPDRFDGYMALARLFTRLGRAAEAQATLETAARLVPETAEVRRQLGESDLEQNRLDAAVAHFQRALELDPTSNAARFGLGVALRRAGRLDAAAAEFDRLAARDDRYPGLALERGIVFEAQGKSDRAAAMYRDALAARPDDPDLLLRLGAAQVAAGQLDAAEETLRRVANARPHSAEAEHFMGRIAFARGDLPKAQAHFDRAIALDGTRAEFHLYSGWVALEQGQYGKALEHVQAAIERDPSLGDAYWIRGEVRLRSGAVQDALADMNRALRLKPSRHEAWAGAGEALDQLRRRSDAVAAYTRAVQGDERNGLWWYRLGRLRMDDGDASAARDALTRATLLGEAQPARPGWLADAHRILGDARRLVGDRNGAVESYRRYLEIASPNAIDRADVERHLARLRGD